MSNSFKKARYTGIQIIESERERQELGEGWTDEHDDSHTKGQLAEAAAVYALRPKTREIMIKDYPDYYGEIDKVLWPFEESWYKPCKDRIKELSKAGALIAAEIDRLQRVKRRLLTLTREEINAFTGFFYGAGSHVTKYAGYGRTLGFGKMECEQVNFKEFWLVKMVDFRWIDVEEIRTFVAKGRKTKPQATEYKLTPTELGFTANKLSRQL
mgnify:CR=1 FL=1